MNLRLLSVLSIVSIFYSCSEQGSVETNQKPECEIIYPLEPTSLFQGETIEIQYNASDVDGEIIKVTLDIDNNQVNESTNQSDKFTLDTRELEYGCHTIKISAFDDKKDIDSCKIMISVNQEFGLNNSGVITDPRDCNDYNWVKIGEQIWMAENLNYNDYESYVYEDKKSNAKIYGRLYTWDIACDVCPKGWHLPSDEEWKELEIYLGMSQETADSGGSRVSDAACKLKTIGVDLWNSPNYCATNESGFSALPSGYRGYLNETNPYYAIGNAALFWTSTNCGDVTDINGNLITHSAWHRVIGYSTNRIQRTCAGTEKALSVRCLKDN